MFYLYNLLVNIALAVCIVVSLLFDRGGSAKCIADIFVSGLTFLSLINSAFLYLHWGS